MTELPTNAVLNLWRCMINTEPSSSLRQDNVGKIEMVLLQWFGSLTLVDGGEVPLACCVGVGPLLCLLSGVEEGLGVDSYHHSLSLLGACGEPGGRSEGACDQTHALARGTLPLAGVHALRTSRCSHHSHNFRHKSLDHMAVNGL